jgi:hypothetical protein
MRAASERNLLQRRIRRRERELARLRKELEPVPPAIILDDPMEET